MSKKKIRPNYFLEGRRTYLRQVDARDFPLITRWLNDQVVTYYMFYGQTPKTEEEVYKHFHEQISNPANTVFIIVNRKTDRPIGFAGIYDIISTARSAEFRVLIGEKEFWGKGYGTEVTELIVFYGFDRLNLNRIYLGVTSEHSGAIKAYKKAGFKEEGVLRQDIYRNSRYYDSVRMGILRDEYYREFHNKYVKRYSFSR